MSHHQRQPGRINEFYTRREELANSVTHGIGALFSIAALVVLVVLAILYGSGWHVASFTIFGASLVLLYVASTLYHTIQHPRLRPILRRLDHAAIFLLIAGTYTPFTLVSLRDSWGWYLFGIVWGLALLGILFKVFFINRLEVVSTLAYIAMGWLCLVAYREMLVSMPPASLSWLIAGGVVYTVGILFYAPSKIPYNHAIWHLFVLGGSVCHFLAVQSLVTAV